MKPRFIFPAMNFTLRRCLVFGHLFYFCFLQSLSIQKRRVCLRPTSFPEVGLREFSCIPKSVDESHHAKNNIVLFCQNIEQCDQFYLSSYRIHSPQMPQHWPGTGMLLKSLKNEKKKLIISKIVLDLIF